MNQARLSTQMSRRVYDSLGKYPSSQSRHQLPFDTTDVIIARRGVWHTRDQMRMGTGAMYVSCQDDEECAYSGWIRKKVADTVTHLRDPLNTPTSRRSTDFLPCSKIPSSAAASSTGTNVESMNRRWLTFSTVLTFDNCAKRMLNGKGQFIDRNTNISMLPRISRSDSAPMASLYTTEQALMPGRSYSPSSRFRLRSDTSRSSSCVVAWSQVTTVVILLHVV